jgi:hypothetical protein
MLAGDRERDDDADHGTWPVLKRPSLAGFQAPIDSEDAGEFLEAVSDPVLAVVEGTAGVGIGSAEEGPADAAVYAVDDGDLVG